MTFKRAIVTAVGPLRIMIDGDTEPIPFTPKSLIDPATLAVGDVVNADQSGHRLVVLGRVGGVSPTSMTAHLQLDTTNSVAKMTTQYGIGKITGTATATLVERPVFPVPFATIPVIGGGFIGGRTPQGAFNTTGLSFVANQVRGNIIEPTLTGLTVVIYRTDAGNQNASYDYYYAWSATGVLA